MRRWVIHCTDLSKRIETVFATVGDQADCHLPSQDALAVVGIMKLFNKRSYEDVQIRDIFLIEVFL